MYDSGEREPVRAPEDLTRFFLERTNTGDVEGVVALYESDAVLVGPGGEQTVGTDCIRRFYEQLLAGRPTFSGEAQPVVRNGDLALTSTRFSTTVVGVDGQQTAMQTATTEVARRQPDGSRLEIDRIEPWTIRLDSRRAREGSAADIP